MRPGPLVLLLAAALTAGGCDDAPPQPGPSPDPGGPTTIRGDERLGWDQPASDSAELATFRFAIYLDGARSEMAGVNCGTPATSAGFPCSGQLPPMTPGIHTLEMAAFLVDDDEVLESPRSAPFRVNVMPALGAPAAGSPETDPPGTDPPGRPPSQPLNAGRFDEIAGGYTDIADARVTPDGWLIVAERAGVLRASGLIDDRQHSALAVAGTRADGASGSLLAIAVDPGFARTGHIYVLQTAPSREGMTWQLARYRQAGAAFGERAVLLETGLAPDAPAGAVRFGPDGQLHVALQDARETRRGRRGLETRETVILRLTADGTTPLDQPAGSPVVAAAPGEARAFDWHPETGSLVVAAGGSDGSARLLALESGRQRARRAAPDRDQPLPGARGVWALRFYDADLIPSLQGALLVAGDSGLHRARVDPQNPSRVLAIDLLADTPVRAVFTAPDGSLVVATPDSVLRVRVE